MDADRNDKAIAKLDAYRANRIGQMLVTGADPVYDADPDDLMDVDEQDGKQLLSDYTQFQSRFGTAPFDVAGNIFRFYPGGLTVWSGFPGAGKTTLLRQFICHCLHRKSSVFLASLEEHPRNVLVNLAAVASGARLPNAHQMQWFIDDFGKRFKLWARIGIAEHRKLLAVIRKLAEQGVKHAIIDSLMCLDVANDDYEGQRKFANLVATTARAANIHIHLVAHPRKLISADQEPDINDVAGAREIGGIADNVIFVRRTKNESAVSSDVTPMVVCIKKQRHGSGELTDITGWFHRDHRQFNLDQFAAGPTRYLPEDAYT
jgi:twinkle protein